MKKRTQQTRKVLEALEALGKDAYGYNVAQHTGLNVQTVYSIAQRLKRDGDLKIKNVIVDDRLRKMMSLTVSGKKLIDRFDKEE